MVLLNLLSLPFQGQAIDRRVAAAGKKALLLGFAGVLLAFCVMPLSSTLVDLTESFELPSLTNATASVSALLTLPLSRPKGPDDPLIDLRIVIAVFLGAATTYVFNFAWAAATRRLNRPDATAGAAATDVAAAVAAGTGTQPFDIPDNACYFCIRRAATSKCGSCSGDRADYHALNLSWLVYYCCRLCQMQAWRKHRHVCGAAAAAATRIHRSRSLISPSQWRDLVEYCDFVRSLVPSTTVVPTAPEMVARILHRIGGYIRQRPELVCQPMADAVWASALSMRSEGVPDRLHMAWAWGFLEASVESGTADAFLAALRINDAGAADLPRVNRWMKRGLCQALLMLNKRQEVGGFFRAAPMQQLLYF